MIQLPPPAVHGGMDVEELERLGIDPAQVLDFSANINPFGPAPKVRDLLMKPLAIDRYPDAKMCLLKRSLADYLGVSAERVLPGNGSSELLWLTVLALLRRQDRVLIAGPTYSEYARAARLMDAAITSWHAREEDDFAIDVDALTRLLDSLRPGAFFLCNPNNPTGTVIELPAIARWVQRHPDTLFVVDEAYITLAGNADTAIKLNVPNVLVLRSMTKDHALAGLRLGYVVADEEQIERMKRVQPPWSVNGFAQLAGVAALGDLGHWQRSLTAWRTAKEELVTALPALGLAPVPSNVPFFLLKVGDAAGFRRDLLQHWVLVRDCASFGLPEHVRISTRRPEENCRLLDAVRVRLRLAAKREVEHAR